MTRTAPVLGLVCVLLACAEPEPTPSSHAEHGTGFTAELLRLGAADHADRAALSGDAIADSVRLSDLRGADSARTVALEGLLDRHGWPTTANVGAAAVEAFFVLARHSPSMAFQDRSASHLSELAEAGAISRPDYAMFLDRYLVDRGKRQRYGTQFTVSKDTLRAEPLEDLSALADLRSAVELPSMARYIEALGKAYGLPVAWPPDKESGEEEHGPAGG